MLNQSNIPHIFITFALSSLQIKEKKMKKIIFAALLFVPLCTLSQSVLTPQQQLEQAKKEAQAAKQAVKEAKKQAKLAAKAAKQQKKNSENEALQEEIRKAKAEAAKYKAEAEKYKKEAAKEAAPTAVTPATEQGDTQGWTVPQTTPKVAPTNRAIDRADKAKSDWKHDPMYLEGAVPENADSKVVFTLNLELPGQSGAQIYDKLYTCLNDLANDEHQKENSRIVLVNQSEGTIVGKYTEWLTFSESFLSLDRTVFNYMLVGKCTDGQMQLTLERISYEYEPERETGFKLSAEELISDAKALNKKKNGLNNGSGKFRRKTIDRKNEIFSTVAAALK